MPRAESSPFRNVAAGSTTPELQRPLAPLSPASRGRKERDRKDSFTGLRESEVAQLPPPPPPRGWLGQRVAAAVGALPCQHSCRGRCRRLHSCLRTRKGKAACGACGVLWLYILLVAIAGARLYGSLSTTNPSFKPISVAGVCAPQHLQLVGKVTLRNNGFSGVSVRAESCQVSLPGDSVVAMSMQQAVAMHFGGSGTTSQAGTLAAVVKDEQRAGQIMNRFVSGHVAVDMHMSLRVKLSILPFTLSVPHSLVYTYESGGGGAGSDRWGPDGCLNRSTIKDKTVQRFTVVRNSVNDAMIALEASMTYYIPYSFSMDVPTTQWRLYNPDTGSGMATFDIARIVVHANSKQLNFQLNVTINKAQAHTAADIFSRVMAPYSSDAGFFSLDMAGTGRGCDPFAGMLQHVRYPVYRWTAALNSTYNSSWAVNPCTPGSLTDVNPRMTLLVEVTKVSVLSTNGTHVRPPPFRLPIVNALQAQAIELYVFARAERCAVVTGAAPCAAERNCLWWQQCGFDGPHLAAGYAADVQHSTTEDTRQQLDWAANGRRSRAGRLLA
eukprot:COSAG01_NODE_667_length_14389_cov_5.828202_17_plen_553_part_00